MLRIEDLSPKAGSRKQKRQQGGWRSPVRAQYYPRNTLRWDSLFVNRKLEKSRTRPRWNGGGKSKPPALIPAWHGVRAAGDFPAGADAQNQNQKSIVLDFADKTVISHAVFPKFSEL